jgi:hypothetical protein
MYLEQYYKQNPNIGIAKVIEKVVRAQKNNIQNMQKKLVIETLNI